MFKYLVFFALLAFAFAAPEAKPQYFGVAPYAYGAHAYSAYSPYYSGYYGYGYGHGYPYYHGYGYY